VVIEKPSETRRCANGSLYPHSIATPSPRHTDPGWLVDSRARGASRGDDSRFLVQRLGPWFTGCRSSPTASSLVIILALDAHFKDQRISRRVFIGAVAILAGTVTFLARRDGPIHLNEELGRDKVRHEAVAGRSRQVGEEQAGASPR